MKRSERNRKRSVHNSKDLWNGSNRLKTQNLQMRNQRKANYINLFKI